jgi:hypothetical protein
MHFPYRWLLFSVDSWDNNKVVEKEVLDMGKSYPAFNSFNKRLLKNIFAHIGMYYIWSGCSAFTPYHPTCK